MFALCNFLQVTCIRKLLPISREAQTIRYHTKGRGRFNKVLHDCPISDHAFMLGLAFSQIKTTTLLICIRLLLSAIIIPVASSPLMLANIAPGSMLIFTYHFRSKLFKRNNSIRKRCLVKDPLALYNILQHFIKFELFSKAKKF